MFGFFEDKATALWNVMAPEATEEEKLSLCIAEGNLGEVQACMQRNGYDVNFRNSNGNMPLHIATFNGKQQLVDYFFAMWGRPECDGAEE
mmetsp:Transcript_1540/g.3210  ORF Transcript_1540/g.3210 Transcript_1540/m.3210 type:complete len:90 (+) Transcript_1540:125-394(+)